MKCDECKKIIRENFIRLEILIFNHTYKTTLNFHKNCFEQIGNFPNTEKAMNCIICEKLIPYGQQHIVVTEVQEPITSTYYQNYVVYCLKCFEECAGKNFLSKYIKTFKEED